MPFHTHQLDAATAIPAHLRQHPHDPLLTISEATTPHLSAAIKRAFSTLRSEITDRVVYDGMTNGNLENQLSRALQTFLGALNSTKIYLANAHMQAMHIVDRQFTVRKEQLVQFDLDTLPQPTIDALDDYDFGLIREVNSDVLNTVSGVINRGIQNGWAPGKMARTLRGSIGLTDSQEQAVENYRRLLEEGHPDALDRELRDKRSDGIVQDAVEGLRSLSPAQVERLVSGYEDRYVNYRADTIARYESLLAANTGAADAVQSAIDAGQLSPDQVTTYWLINDDELTCPKCRSIVDLQPDGVPFGNEFQWATVPLGKKGKGHQGSILLAPLHPSCRCTNTFRVTGE